MRTVPRTARRFPPGRPLVRGIADLRTGRTFRGNSGLSGARADSITVDAGAGHDQITGSGGRDILFDGAGNDRLYGRRGDDTLNGESGRDYLLGGPGINRINGGAATDNDVYADRSRTARRLIGR